MLETLFSNISNSCAICVMAPSFPEVQRHNLKAFFYSLQVLRVLNTVNFRFLIKYNYFVFHFSTFMMKSVPINIFPLYSWLFSSPLRPPYFLIPAVAITLMNRVPNCLIKQIRFPGAFNFGVRVINSAAVFVPASDLSRDEKKGKSWRPNFP